MSICKRMIFGDQIKQHGCLFFYARVKFSAIESLVYGIDRTIERFVFFISKQVSTPEFTLERSYNLQGFVIGGTESGCLGCVFNFQFLKIIPVERIQPVSVIGNYPQ